MRIPFLVSAAALLAVSASSAMAANYTIDPTHTFVTFQIDHFATTTNRGRFDNVEGTVEFDRAAKTGKVDVTVGIASISTGTPSFDKHLQSEQLLDVAKYPTARFVSDKFEFDGDKVKEVKGQLTLLGQTHPVTVEADRFNCYSNPMLQGREVCGGDFQIKIDRTKWGSDFGVQNGVAKDMKIVIQFEAIKAD